MVKTTVLHLNNRAQVEAILNDSITLGIGFYSDALEEDEREHVSVRLPVGIIYSKNRRFQKGAVPKLKDFRHDKFISLEPEYGFGYEQWLRRLCQRLGGFEPEIAALANSPENVMAMVAAGRGVFVGPELGLRGRLEFWRSMSDLHLLTGFEIFAIWKKQSQVEPILPKFIELLVAELKSP